MAVVLGSICCPEEFEWNWFQWLEQWSLNGRGSWEHLSVRCKDFAGRGPWKTLLVPVASFDIPHTPTCTPILPTRLRFSMTAVGLSAASKVDLLVKSVEGLRGCWFCSWM